MKKILTTLVLIGILFSIMPIANAAFKYSSTITSVVQLQIVDSKGDEYLGSGTLISNDGVILTAAHVIIDQTTGKPAEYIDICMIESASDIPSCEYSGRVLSLNGVDAYDIDLDLALIYPAYKLDENRNETGKFLSAEDVQALKLPYADFADFKPELGDNISILGYPVASLTGTISLTKGIVSGLVPYDENHNWVIQTDATVNPGNSGGPAYNDDERILGVINLISTEGEGGNYGYIIDADMILLWFTDLADKGVLNKEFVSEIFTNDQIESADTTDTKIFTDVSFTDKNAEAINYLKQNNIVSGNPDGSYGATKPLNRAELLRIIIEGAGYNTENLESKNCFSDVAADTWYAKYVCFAKEQNWITGYEGNKFKPTANVLKSEALRMLLEVLKRDLGNPTEKPFLDVEVGMWYAKYVQTAKDLGLLEETGLYYHPADTITRGEISENLYRLLLIIYNKENVK